MQRLAELRQRLFNPDLHPYPDQPILGLQARLLGSAGLLPKDLTRVKASNDAYVRQLWDCWWRDRSSFQDCALPPQIWKFSGLRPANHPQRRLALASHWLANNDLPTRLREWGTSTGIDITCRTVGLHQILKVPGDKFWSKHWTLHSKPNPQVLPLIGVTRTTDLAVNVIIPWLWALAVEGRNEDIRKEMETCYFSWPASEDNAVLRLARLRLLGMNAPSQALKGSAGQQGLLQIVKDFCEHSNALCTDCRFPELAREWGL
jgi:hypothetical protein